MWALLDDSVSVLIGPRNEELDDDILALNYTS